MEHEKQSVYLTGEALYERLVKWALLASRRAATTAFISITWGINCSIYILNAIIPEISAMLS